MYGDEQLLSKLKSIDVGAAPGIGITTSISMLVFLRKNFERWEQMGKGEVKGRKEEERLTKETCELVIG